jgi:hypothetical protein
MITKAKVLNIHWDEKETSVWEATLEAEHEDGSIQMFVIPIVRMTNRIKNADTNSNGQRTEVLRTRLTKHRRTR